MLVFFLGGGGIARAIIARYVANLNGLSHKCACVKLPFWRSANLPEKVSRDMGYRSDSIAISRDMGPLRCSEGGQDPQGQKVPNSLKTLRFSGILCTLKGIASVASRGRESEKHRLENTVGESRSCGFPETSLWKGNFQLYCPKFQMTPKLGEP